jgi:hypothetical protein
MNPALLIVITMGLAMMLTACDNSPSCEEMGGTRVRTGSYLMPLLIGTSTYLIPQPSYGCVMPSEGRKPSLAGEIPK